MLCPPPPGNSSMATSLYSRNIKSSFVLQQYLTNVLISVCFFAFLATRRWRYVGRGARPVWCGWTTPLRRGALFFMARGEIEVKRLRFVDSESGLVSPLLVSETCELELFSFILHCTTTTTSTKALRSFCPVS